MIAVLSLLAVGVLVGFLLGRASTKPTVVTVRERPQKVFFTASCTVYHVEGCSVLRGSTVKQSAIKERGRCFHCG